LRVHGRPAPHEAARRDHVAGELGVPGVDAGVDDGDPHRRERGRLRPGVVGVVREQVPLPRDERIRGRERRGRRDGGERGDDRRGDAARHQAGASTTGIVIVGPGNPAALSLYVVVSAGRTTVANVPSAATRRRRTTGAQAPSAPRCSSEAEPASRATPVSRTGTPTLVGLGGVTKRRVPRRKEVERSPRRLRASAPVMPSVVPSAAVTTRLATRDDAVSLACTSTTGAAS